MLIFFFFKQKTAYEMRISDWSSDVCSSDLLALRHDRTGLRRRPCQSDRPLRRRSRRFSSTSAHSGSCTHSGFRAGTLSDAGASAFGPREPAEDQDRKSVVEGKRAAVCVDIGGRRTLKQKRDTIKNINK